jgi:D-alanyl-D-alanine carboxypeptidase (penicillin-binding protein 5/6)
MIKRVLIIGGLATVAWTAVGAALLWTDRADNPDPERPARTVAEGSGPAESSTDRGAPAPTTIQPVAPPAVATTPTPVASPGLVPVSDGTPPVSVTLKEPPAAGMLFDVSTGEVLWELNPDVKRPIASLTKMMTALMIAERHSPREKVMISSEAAHFPESGVGVLPEGRRVRLKALFAGLILASGNDAAVALAEHDAGTVEKFAKRMNTRAAQLGLSCSRFISPHGLYDKSNYSCARDLAGLARADLANPQVRKVVAMQRATLPFPIKGGKLHLTNNHYFVQQGLPRIPGARVTGLKTGYTAPAGRCYVVTARRGKRELGVVLLDSRDPLTQVPKLLLAGFRAG